MALQVFWRVFSRLIRIKLVAVGIVFVGIGVVLALTGFAESSYLPATGVIVSTERSGSGYEAVVNVTRDGVTTPVEMELWKKAGRAPKRGDKLDLLQSPTSPTRVSQVLDTGSRFRDMSVFWAIATLMLWIGIGAKLPRRKQKLAVPAMATPKSYGWQQSPEPRPSAVVDYSRARVQQQVVAEGRRIFGRR